MNFHPCPETMVTRTAVFLSFCVVALGKVQLNLYSDGDCKNYKTSATIVKPIDSYGWVYNAQSVLIAECSEVLPNQNRCNVELYWQGNYEGALTAGTGGGSSCLKLPSQNDGLTTTAIRYYNVYQD